MKKTIVYFLFVAIAAALCACGDPKAGNTEIVKNESQTQSEIKESEEETEFSSQEGMHSTLYNENYTVEQVVEYFNEVVLDVEYATGEGDFRTVQKWTEPIYYRISGETTQEDMEVLENLFRQLNEVEGFPGIYAASENDYVNLTIDFYNYHDFNVNMGEVVNYEMSDGAVEYWYYNDTNNIYQARVGYRTDINQFTRNSVLLEEIINGLGLSDTLLREDSIVYQGFSETQNMSEMDWLILKLMYSSQIECGMNHEECRAVIEKLYY